jgi:hypothetical protein
VSFHEREGVVLSKEEARAVAAAAIPRYER